MKYILLNIYLFVFCTTGVFAQGWVTKNVNIVIKDDAHIVVNEATGNYKNVGTGIVKTVNQGTIHVDGNWINNGTSHAIGNNAGEVILTGTNQTITGTKSTSFNNLTLSGSGSKTLQTNTLVGGGYNGGQTGQLTLNDRTLILNSNTLVVNNNDTTAVSRTTGFIVGETDPSTGYGKVQWNIRTAPAGNNYTIPFGTTDNMYIPLIINIADDGYEVSDSGYITVASYPTNPISVPNNRPLPIGVPHLDNLYKIANDIKSLDRFYILGSDGYSTKPQVQITFSYTDREWDLSLGGLNDIIESELEASRYNSITNSWDYTLSSTTNPLTNATKTPILSEYDGAWVLNNYPKCPTANFTFKNDCDLIPILFSDSSYIDNETIDTSVWSFENQQAYNQASLLHTFSKDGFFDISRKVRGDRGCWDSITKTIQIYPLPNSIIEYTDTCFGQSTKFISLSNSSLGMPLKHDWDIEGNSFNTPSTSFTFSQIGQKSIQLITENTLGCFDTLTTVLEIEPLPMVNFYFDNICERQEAFFIDSTQTKGKIEDWTWSVSNKVVSLIDRHNQVFNIAGAYPIKLNVTNSFGCKDSAEKQITVWPKAKAKFDIFPKEIFITDPFVNFVESGSDANNWEWDFGDFTPVENGPEALHQYTDTGYFRSKLIANNDFNCADTFYRTIRIKPNLRIFIPNAFSPGPDNDVNRTFGPAGMLYGLKSMELDIYTRWGEHIYHSEDVNKPWDGMYQGVLVQEGTYLYLIKLKDIYNDVFRYSGTLTVIR